MPFDASLITKISPLIEGQVPDFVQSDHPIFVQFLKQYYQFLFEKKLKVKYIDPYKISAGDNKIELVLLVIKKK